MDQPNTYREALTARAKLPIAQRVGISTGWDKMDDVMRGFHPGKLYTIGARPGDGKTSFGTSLGANMLHVGEDPFLFFSTELDEWEILDQMTESLSGGISIFPNGRMPRVDEVERLSEAAGCIEAAIKQDFFKVVCSRKLTTRDIGVQAAEFFDGLHGGVKGLLILDQASRIARDDASGRRNYAVATENMLNDIEQLIAQLNIPAVLFSQANRDADKLKRPTMSNLKHSGAFEEYSHFVAMLEKKEHEEATVWVEKNRHGRTGPLESKFYGESHSWDVL